MTDNAQPLPFQLTRHPGAAPRGGLLALLRACGERALHFPELNHIYQSAVRSKKPEFPDGVLDAVDVNYQIAPAELSRIPKTGPVVVVANHPFGMLDGIVLASVLRSVRPDAKVMANLLLDRIPELRESMLFVDPFGTKDSARQNLAPLRAAIEWVRAGHMLAMFPAGEVAHLRLKDRAVVDPPWSDTASRLIRRTGADALPIFIEGRNSRLFQLAGLIHPRLRTLMLPREMVNKRKTTVVVRVGKVIPNAKIVGLGSHEDQMLYLRSRTYFLGGASQAGPVDSTPDALSQSPRPEYETIIPPVAPDLLKEEIASLSPEHTLVDAKEYAILLGRADEIPNLLREIGRLREVTFRKAGEGTGKSIDSDRFDEDYLHLCLWHKGKGEVAGAYRLGQTDVILAKHGLSGLYTSTLFKFKPALLDQISPALELGRSFVREEYQKSHAPLAMLWRGIGRFLVAHPQYRYLFGPVSINNEYRSLSQQLIVTFLKEHSYLSRLARLVKPFNPPRLRAMRDCDLKATCRVVADIDEVSSLISQIESDQKGVPVLLRQYLKLGAKLLGFNVDPDFGLVIDGLILIDITQTNPRMLRHYMGDEGLQSFLDHHRPS